MSYHVKICIDTGGPELACVEDVGSYTSNVRPMFVTASCGLGPTDLDNTACPNASEILRDVVRAMEDEPERYEAMNPVNGWGSRLTFLEFLRSWIAACERHPKAVVAVSA